MEILFKSDVNIFFISDNKLSYNNQLYYPEDCIQKITHLDTLPVLFHIRKYDKLLPVYFEFNGSVIYKNSQGAYHVSSSPVKDYTVVNINNLKNGNII